MSLREVQRIQERFEYTFREGLTPWKEHGLEPEIPAFANALLRETREPHVLDIGCGSGWVSLYFGSRGIQVVGIDSSVTAIDEATRAAHEEDLTERVHFDAGDALVLPYPAESFDGLFDRGLFHHVPEDEYGRYLGGVTRVLKNGGLLSLHAFTKRNLPTIGHRFDAGDIVRIFGPHFVLLEYSEDPWPTSAPAHLGHYLLRKRQ